MALHPGAAAEGGVPPCHHLAAGRVREFVIKDPDEVAPPLGPQEVQTTDELRQAEPGFEVGKRIPKLLCDRLERGLSSLVDVGKKVSGDERRH